MKTGIIYLSVSGNTERIARLLATKINGAELIAVDLKTTIPSSEFWMFVKIGFLMWWGRGIRFAVPDFSPESYDRIIIGGPIWMGKIAQPISRILTKYKLQNKLVGVFWTSGMDLEKENDSFNPLPPDINSYNNVSFHRSELDDEQVVAEKIDRFVLSLIPAQSVV